MARQIKKGFVTDAPVGGDDSHDSKGKTIYGSVQARGRTAATNRYHFQGSEATSFTETRNGPAPRSKQRHPIARNSQPVDPTES